MALEATHIRFALSVKDAYHVTDVGRYMRGTVYPDSRYLTGIDRDLTHPADYVDWKTDQSDDFKKGWLVHLLADDLQRRIIQEQLPALVEGDIRQGNETWINLTAIKILQDLIDVKQVDIQAFLPAMTDVENPHGEDRKKIGAYHRILLNMYAEPTRMSTERCYEMWSAFGISDEIVDGLRRRTEALQHDPATMQVVTRLYDAMCGYVRM